MNPQKLIEWLDEQIEREHENTRESAGHLQSMAMAASDAYFEVKQKVQEMEREGE